MKQFYLTVTLVLFLSISAYAQRSIQSTVFDSKNGQPIELGTVRLLRQTDSTLVQGCNTDLKGSFMLSKVKPGNYILAVSSIGYLKYYKNIAMQQKDVILKSIQLSENAHLLKEVEVKGTAAQMVVKGDTLEYNANAFKTTENAVVEDLLKRLPGAEVTSDGKIKINGEEIKKIRVNGKKFFGDDVEMTTKNIPAEMIDKIQVLDQKSDMALLTGFEDNDTERIINLTFKTNRKRGTFGNISGGAGLDTEDKVRYDGNMFLNMIDGETQTTLTGGGNNANTSRSSRGRNGGGFGGISSGINTTQNIGVNNSSTINNKIKIGGDASLNHSSNETINESNQTTFLKDLNNTNNSKNIAHNENYSANLRLEMEYKLDSLNTIIFQPTLSYNKSYSDSNRDYSYLSGADSTSRGTTINNGSGTTLNGGLGIIYNHKFASKKGRTFTANFQSGISQNDNESYNTSYNYNFLTASDTTINQRTTNKSNKYNVSLRMSLVEPLWNLKNFLETAVSFSDTYNTSDKIQYNKDVNGDYTSINNEYSNNYDNRFNKESLELNYRYIDKKYNLMFGMKGEPSQTYSSILYNNGTPVPITKNVFNFSPTARLQYNFGKKKFARIDYRGQTNQPDISQMQPIKNNSNLMNEIVGNPNLNPAFNQSLRIMYSSFNDQTFSSLNTFINANFTKDALVTNSIYDNSGKQYSQTVNADVMPFSLFGNVMFNTPLIKKRLQFNTATSAGYSRSIGYSSKGLNNELIDVNNFVLGDRSNTPSYNLGENLSLTFTQDLFEIGIRGGVRYTNTVNNLSKITTEITDWTGAGNIVAHLPYSINIGTDLNYTTRQGYGNFDQNQLIWNATIDKTVFKSKGVIALKVYDILHQQLNIRQTIGDNSISFNKYNTLTSYFMLSFTLKINKFAGAKNNPAETNPMDRFGPPGGDHPRGDRGSDGGGFRGGFRGGND